jgi:hypothetical protein
MNDLLLRRFDAAQVASHVGDMVHTLASAGATVVMFTIPDAAPRMRLGRAMTARTEALNVELRRIAAHPNVVLLDLASYELAGDPRMWAVDRLHGNPEGHRRIAAELAHLLQLPDTMPGSLGPIAPAPPRRRHHVLAEDLRWIARFVAPWAWRRLRGKTLGDGRSAKRPTLTPVR